MQEERTRQPVQENGSVSEHRITRNDAGKYVARAYNPILGRYQRTTFSTLIEARRWYEVRQTVTKCLSRVEGDR